MKTTERKTIGSVEEFKQFIEEYQNKTDYIFRGQANADWNIVSSAYRFIKEAYPSLKITNEILVSYEQRIPEYVEKDYPKVYEGVNESLSKLLCILQHMGGKTTYVDFSKSFMVASYFACEQYKDKDGMIFICKKTADGKVCNLKGTPLGEVIEISKEEIELLNYPAATSRMQAQRSCFLKIQKDTTEESLLSHEDISGKKDDEKGEDGCILIPKNVKDEILEYLNKERIYRQTIYPDIYDFISHQNSYNEYAHDFSKSILRGVSQTIKDGCIKRVSNALMTIDYLIKNQRLGTEELMRCDYLRVLGLQCEQKFTHALNILAQMKETYKEELQKGYHIFKPYDNDNKEPMKSDDYDPIPQLFIISFEQAKCYMGLKDYDKSEICFEKTEKIIKTIQENNYNSNSAYSPGVCIDDFWKCYAKALVRKEKNNLAYAKELLAHVINSETDKAELYVIAEEWDNAIDKLKTITEEREDDDYACNLLGNCYMALAKSGSNRYIEKAIKYYDKALRIIDNRSTEMNVSRYIPNTESHDHYYKLAIAYKEKGDFAKSAENYIIIAKNPYENEDAMHDLAYMRYKEGIYHKLEVSFEQIFQDFASAITQSRMEKCAKNFNDLGCFLFDIYKQHTSDGLSEYKNALPKLSPVWQQQDGYPLKIKVLLDTLPEIAKDETWNNLLKMSERMFEIANYLHDNDAFANKKLGDIHFTQYTLSANYEEKQGLGKKALTAYSLAKCFYLSENKRCAEIEQNIELLNKTLTFKIEEVNDEK